MRWRYGIGAVDRGSRARRRNTRNRNGRRMSGDKRVNGPASGRSLLVSKPEPNERQRVVHADSSTVDKGSRHFAAFVAARLESARVARG
jgi:hypothetical protein